MTEIATRNRNPNRGRNARQLIATMLLIQLRSSTMLAWSHMRIPRVSACSAETVSMDYSSSVVITPSQYRATMIKWRKAWAWINTRTPMSALGLMHSFAMVV